MYKATACICCGSTNLTSWAAELMPFIAHRTRLNKDCRSVKCNDCGAVFCDVRFDDDEMDAIYKDYRGEQYTHKREQFEPGYYDRQAGVTEQHPHIEQIEDFLRPHLADNFKVLDWGGNNGINTPFKEMQADIYDPSGVDVRHGNKVQEPHNEYDLIVFANVIEHIPDPLKVLEHIKRHMNNKTLLYIEVSLDDATNKKRWHEHINIFTAKSLRKLCTRAGLVVAETKQLEVLQYHPYLMACYKENE